MKTIDKFLSFGNQNNKIVECLIEYVKNNDIKKISGIDMYSHSIFIEFSIRNSERNSEIDPFEEEIGENDKTIKLSWNPATEYVLRINEEIVKGCSQRLLDKLYHHLNKK